VTEGNIRGLIGERKLFPCRFGSALKLTGVEQLLQTLDTYAPRRESGDTFAARVYKISRDPQGNRLTWLKITGGSLKVRSVISYVNQKGESKEER
jgi:translation elongation factor EF-G